MRDRIGQEVGIGHVIDTDVGVEIADQARGALSQALHYLRSSLTKGALFNQGEEEVGLDQAVIGCDAVAFQTLCDADQLETALGLYQGPFLANFFVAEAGPEYERWAMEERAAFRQRAAQAAATLAERAESQRDLGSALRWSRREVTILLGEEVPTRVHADFTPTWGDGRRKPRPSRTLAHLTQSFPCQSARTTG